MSRLMRRSRPPSGMSASDITSLSAGSDDDDSDKNASKLPWRSYSVKMRTTLFLATALAVTLLARLQHFRAHMHHKSQRRLPVSVLSVDTMHALPLSLSEDPPHFVSDRHNHYWLNHGVQQYGRVTREPENCTVLNGNYDDNYPNCNDFHQIDMTDFWLFEDRHATKLEGTWRQSKLRHVGEGGFRNAFYISEYNGTRRVLKTHVWRDDRPFDPKTADKNRKDAVIASQLTSSNLIANIHGYCSYSALVDYSDDWDMYSLFDDDTNEPTKEYLFDLAVDIAQSVADAHLYNSKGQATVVHMDLKPDQWIKLNGKYVLNDFNLAKFISINEDTNEYCSLASGYSDGRWQAPEQFNSNYPRTAMADVFALGYILNFLLTKDKPFPDLTGAQAMKYVMNGGIWNVPKDYHKSTHPFDVALRQAVQWCLKFEPSERPSAQEVADFLSKARDRWIAKGSKS